MDEQPKQQQMIMVGVDWKGQKQNEAFAGVSVSVLVLFSNCNYHLVDM